MIKQFFILTFLVLAGFFMTSCKKDYTCKCTYKNVDGQEGHIFHYFENTTKAEAKLGCDSQDKLFKLGDPENAKCELE